MKKPITSLPFLLNPILGKVENRIALVGIELEGGWSKLPEGVEGLVHDGSVRIDARGEEGIGAAPELLTATLTPNQRRNQELEAAARRLARGRGDPPPPPPAPRRDILTGELPSHPLEVKDFPTWMRASYPTHVNATCGLHVHMSFKSALYYQLLMTPAYQATIIAYLTKWAREEGLVAKHPIWPRLAGKSEYAQHLFHADQQACTKQKDHDRKRPGHRYTAISYPYSQHGTVECRILPMMEDVRVGISAVQAVLDITNASLVAAAKHEERLRLNVPPDHYSEVRVEGI